MAMIVPLHPSSTWFPLFLCLSKAPPFLLPANISKRLFLFMLQLLQRRKIPARSASHIAEFGWIRNTHVRYSYVIKDWRTFCKEQNKDPYDINLNNSLELLDYLTFDLKNN